MEYWFTLVDDYCYTVFAIILNIHITQHNFQISSQKFLSIGHCNIQGGFSGNLGKTTEIQDVIFREKLDLFGINETNLKSTVHNSTLNIPMSFIAVIDQMIVAEGVVEY